jgi:hypothetical protein
MMAYKYCGTFYIIICQFFNRLITIGGGSLEQLREFKKEGHRILAGKSEGKRPLGTPRRRWENSTKTNQRNRMRWYGLD